LGQVAPNPFNPCRKGKKRLTSSVPPENEFLRAVLDANPSFMFVVDEDVRIIEFNRAAGQLLSAGRDQVLRRRGGDVLHCLHSAETPEGCGHAPSCRTCVVRDSVKESFRGQSVVRRKTKMELLSGGKTQDLYALVTTSPFRFGIRKLALLVIEDITELEEIRRIIPICSKCKKIRDDQQYWAELEKYFKEHMDLDFSHGLCPECFQKFMGEIKRYQAEENAEETKE
jgi:hypothetical protein